MTDDFVSDYNNVVKSRKYDQMSKETLDGCYREFLTFMEVYRRMGQTLAITGYDIHQEYRNRGVETPFGQEVKGVVKRTVDLTNVWSDNQVREILEHLITFSGASAYELMEIIFKDEKTVNAVLKIWEDTWKFQCMKDLLVTAAAQATEDDPDAAQRYADEHPIPQALSKERKEELMPASFKTDVYSTGIHAGKDKLSIGTSVEESRFAAKSGDSKIKVYNMTAVNL